MICPHCKKAIKRPGRQSEVEKKVVENIIKLGNDGFSVRDIEKLLFQDGTLISYSTVHRILKEHQRK